MNGDADCSVSCHGRGWPRPEWLTRGTDATQRSGQSSIFPSSTSIAASTTRAVVDLAALPASTALVAFAVHRAVAAVVLNRA
jgi:hypothetical protein